MRLKRRGLMRDYIKCFEETEAGAEHIHCAFRGSFIEQQFLSHLWQIIHNSPIVDIRQVKQGYKSKRNVASYLAKYMSKEFARRYSWSWGWVYKGFVKTWKQGISLFRKIKDFAPLSEDFRSFLDYWHKHVRGLLSADDFLLGLEAELEDARTAYWKAWKPS